MKDNFTRDEVKEIWNAARVPYPFKHGQSFIYNSLEDYEASRMFEKVKYPEGILEFNVRDGSWSLSNTYEPDKIYYEDWVNLCIKYEGKITRVKNEKGEILSIGDNTNHGIIKSFQIDNGGRITINNYPYTIDEVHHDPVFKTEDGYAIKADGATYYKANNNFQLVEYLNIRTQSQLENLMFEGKVFYRSENAKEYIESRKPRFSKQDILDAVTNSINFGDSPNNIMLIDKDKLGL